MHVFLVCIIYRSLIRRAVAISISCRHQVMAPSVHGPIQGAYIVGGETRLQSADRCVMRQRTGTSVFYERLREGA